MKYCLLFITISLFFVNCKTHRVSSGEVYLLSMEEHPFAISTIDKGTSIELIAFSGGKESTAQTTYYDQFIGVTNGGDTVRVLTPLINTGDQNTWTSPLQYNYEKGIKLATIQPMDSSLYVPLNMYVNSKSLETSTTATDFDKLKQKSNAEEMIVMVRGIALFESPRYKTVVGGLHFDEVPW